jgi:hypothetical protein
LPELGEHELPLLNFLREPDAALFIGSGISTWSGLPNWEHLLGLLIDRCRALGGDIASAEEALKQQELATAADFICEQMTASEIARELRPHLHAPNVTPASIHKEIAALGINRFVTTNYDPLLERQMAQRVEPRTYLTVTNRNLAELADIQKASADNFIFKIHGDIADAESIVLSDTHYRAIFENPDNPARQALETIFLSRPVLFLGYGLRDPDLQFILRTLQGRYRGNGGFFWAILPDLLGSDRERLWRDFRIRAVTYSTRAGTPDNPHADLLRLISALGSRKATLQAMASAAAIDPDAELDVAVMRYAARILKRPTERMAVSGFFYPGFEGPPLDERLRRLSGRDVPEILASCGEDIVVVGPAGSGKSNSVTELLSMSSQALIDELASDGAATETRRPKFPIRFDCQAYTGSFRHLMRASVPSNLDLGAASKRYEIVLLVDSIDEMPAQYLDDQSWRQELRDLQTEIGRPITIYFSRRRDLVPDELPTLYVERLAEEAVEKALVDFGVDKTLFPASFLEQIRTPFLLNLTRRITRRGKIPRSSWELLRDYVGDALAGSNNSLSAPAVFDALSNLAAATLLLGRETFPYDLFQKHMRDCGAAHESLADSLVGIGLLRSEIDRRLRFTHRTLTEFFASRWLQAEWLSGRLNLGDVLRSRQMDNAIVWASAGMRPERARQLLDAVMAIDASLAMRIAQLAESDRELIWKAVLPALSRFENHSRDGWRVADQLDQSDLPMAALPYLVDLFESTNDDISGRAIAKALSYMSDEEVRGVISDLCSGRFSFNQMNKAGPAIGQRINASLLPDFQSAILQIPFGEEAEKDGSGILHGFQEAIENLQPEFVDRLVIWGAIQDDPVQELLVYSLLDRSPKEASQLAVELLNRKSVATIFPVLLRGGRNDPLIAPFTDDLCNWLISLVVRTTELGDRGRWSLGLLRLWVDGSEIWRREIETKAPRSIDEGIVLSLLTPATRVEALHSMLDDILRKGRPVSALYLAIVHAFEDTEAQPLFSEEDILHACETFGADRWKVVEPFLSRFFTGTAPLAVTMIDRWIAMLRRLEDSEAHNACLYVAGALSQTARDRLLHRANDAADLDRDFLLQELAPHVPHITTDALTDSTGMHLLELYFRNSTLPWGTPGEISTERFIEQVVLPYARERNHDEKFLAGLNRLLAAAGDRHDRRYRL